MTVGVRTFPAIIADTRDHPPAARGRPCAYRSGMRRTPVEQPVAFVEIPKGSRNKYEYDERLGRVLLDRTLRSSMVYPCDYGFLLDTIADDGDPVDVLVLVTAATFPGCLIPCDPVGMLDMHDEAGRDPKLLCVPHDDPAWSRFDELGEIRESLLDEIAHFFEVYKDLEPGKHVVVDGWRSREEALAVYEAGRQAFLASSSQHLA
jgi:inorganic pyrophosphatase